MSPPTAPFKRPSLTSLDPWRFSVAVPAVVPPQELRRPSAGFFMAVEGSSGVVRSVLDRTEQRFRFGVVVADPGPGEEPEDPQLLQPALRRCCPHGIAVVGMEDQRLDIRRQSG